MRGFVSLIAVAILAGCSAPGGVEVSELTLNDAPPTARMRAGYLSVTNGGSEDLTLLSARSDAFGKVEFHRSSTEDGQARMRREDKVPIPAGQTVVLEPFGLHLMLMMPSQPRVPDAQIAVELCFDSGECITSRTDSL